ncbi:MAG: hypothetical protein ACK4RV_12295 [Caulobacter sp.]|jgi:hypothetical protein
MKLLLAATAAFALAASAVSAQQAPDTKPAAATETGKSDAKRDPGKMVCKKTPVLGTRFPTKVCKTRGDWDKQAETDKQAVDDMQRQGLANCGTTPCN